MIEIRRNGERYELTLSELCEAPPEAVYDILVDLSTHMEWGGSWHPTRTQRLQSMEAPVGPATVGTEFSSVGSASGGSWYDHSKVVVAQRPFRFEFRTAGRLRNGQGEARMALSAIHRYDIVEVDEGCQVTYACDAILSIPTMMPRDHHSRLPLVVFNLVVPSVVERGLHNLVHMAEDRIVERFEPLSTSSIDPLAQGM